MMISSEKFQMHIRHVSPVLIEKKESDKVSDDKWAIRNVRMVNICLYV